MNPQKHAPTEEEKLEEAEAHRELDLKYWGKRVSEHKTKFPSKQIFSGFERLASNERDYQERSNPFG